MQKTKETAKSISKHLDQLSEEERLYVMNVLNEYYIQYVQPIEILEEYKPMIENAIKVNEKKIDKILKKLSKLEETKVEVENEKLTPSETLLIVLIIVELASLSSGSFREIVDYAGYEAIVAILGGSVGIGVILYSLFKLLENKKLKKINKLYSDLDELEKNKNKLENDDNLIKQFSFYRKKVRNTIDSI